MTLKLNGSSSGSVSIDAPASTTGGADLAYTLPDATTGGVIRTTTTPGAIVQVLTSQVTAASTLSLSSANTFYNLAAMNLVITPAKNTNKILVSAHFSVEGSTYDPNISYRLGRIVGGTTANELIIGDASSNRLRCTGLLPYSDNDQDSTPSTVHISNFLDSPTTTSAITYGLWFSSAAASQTLYLNQTKGTTDSASYERSASWITLMEVAA